MIEIDGIAFRLQRHGGVSVYHREMLSRMARDGYPARLSLVEPDHFGDPSRVAGLDIRRRPARVAERYRAYPVQDGATATHSTYYRVPERRDLPLVTSVYDFVYERYWRGPALWVHRAQKRHAILRSSLVICISRSTADDLLRFVPQVDARRVHVIHLGASEAFRPERVEPPDRPFVLFVGKREGYKNFALLAAAMEQLPGMDVVCVGGERPGDRDHRPLPRELAASGRIRMLGGVDDATLNRLYNQATCLAYTSLYEGFGIPVVEAMRAGCPVVTAGCASVMEVAGEACRNVPPDSPGALATAIRELSAGPARQEMVDAGRALSEPFTWERCYRRTIEAYAEVGRANPRRTAA